MNAPRNTVCRLIRPVGMVLAAVSSVSAVDLGISPTVWNLPVLATGIRAVEDPPPEVQPTLAEASVRELVERNLYLKLEMLPFPFSYRIEGPNGDFDDESSYSMHSAIALGYRRSLAGAGSRHGAVVGFELALLQGTMDGGSLIGTEARLLLGWAWQMAPAWTIGFDLMGAYGYDSVDLEIAGLGTQTATGSHVALQPEVRATWAVSDRWRLGLSTGWRMEEDYWSDSDIDVRLHSSGLCFGLSFEMALSRAPSSLE